MSGGVFVYLACCDLLIHQFHHAPFVSKCENLKKYIAMCCGAGIVIFLIAIAPAHEHWWYQFGKIPNSSKDIKISKIKHKFLI